MVTREQRIARAQERAERQYQQQLIDTWREQIPERHRGFTVEDDLFENRWNGAIARGSMQKLKRYVKEPSNFLIMRGPKGTGKTTLAIALADYLIQNHEMIRSARYFPVVDLLQQFSFPDEGTNPVRACQYPSVLILDDVGASGEGITPHQKKSLWSVIDHRWAHNKPTIMTTNMAISSNDEGIGMSDWFGESAWDRIQDDSVLVPMSGIESFRTSE